MRGEDQCRSGRLVSEQSRHPIVFWPFCASKSRCCVNQNAGENSEVGIICLRSHGPVRAVSPESPPVPVGPIPFTLINANSGVLTMGMGASLVG